MQSLRFRRSHTIQSRWAAVHTPSNHKPASAVSTAIAKKKRNQRPGAWSVLPCTSFLCLYMIHFSKDGRREGRKAGHVLLAPSKTRRLDLWSPSCKCLTETPSGGRPDAYFLHNIAVRLCVHKRFLVFAPDNLEFWLRGMRGAPGQARMGQLRYALLASAVTLSVQVLPIAARKLLVNQGKHFVFNRVLDH